MKVDDPYLRNRFRDSLASAVSLIKEVQAAGLTVTLKAEALEIKEEPSAIIWVEIKDPSIQGTDDEPNVCFFPVTS